jgi:hypothetical protein
MARKSLEGARQPAMGKSFMEGRLLPQDEMPSPLGNRHFNAYLAVRTSQDCGSCTA